MGCKPKFFGRTQNIHKISILPISGRKKYRPIPKQGRRVLHEMSEIEKGVLQPKTFSIKWKIERFFADCVKTGYSYKSQVFPIEYSAQLTKWSLRVYPKGDRAENKDYVALYLSFQSDHISEMNVDYKLSIESKQNILFKSGKAQKFDTVEPSWGWTKFEKQDVIKDPKKGVLIDDTLTISCEVTFCSTSQEVIEKIKDYDDVLNKIGKGFEDYEKLLENNYFSDVTFNIEGKKMYLHKAILMCRNPVFKAMFEHEMKEKKESSVDITDVNYDTMKELIRFVYSGKVENIEKVAKDLLIAADKYAVEGLKALCEKTLCHKLTVDNAIEYFKLTEMCDTIHLKTLTMNFVVEHYKEVVAKSEFEELPSIIMCEMFRAVASKK